MNIDREIELKRLLQRCDEYLSSFEHRSMMISNSSISIDQKLEEVSTKDINLIAFSHLMNHAQKMMEDMKNSHPSMSSYTLESIQEHENKLNELMEKTKLITMGHDVRIEDGKINVDDSTILPTLSQIKRRKMKMKINESMNAVIKEKEKVHEYEEKVESDDILDFEARDFVAEENLLVPPENEKEALTTNEIRRRLGINREGRAEGIGSSKDRGIEYAKKEHDSIQSEMVDLTKRLRQGTENINKTLQEDSSMLDTLADNALSCKSKVDKENSRLQVQLNDGLSIWTVLLLIVGVMVLFVIMFLFIKIFPKRI